MLVVNIGGEGEVPGAVNVNSPVFPLRRLEEIRRAGPLIQGDFTRLPLRSRTVDEVVGNRLPFLHGWVARRMCEEAFRVLKKGGAVRLETTLGGGRVLVPYLEVAGFIGVRLVANHAVGVRP
jgi:Methyltransferase domain